MTQRAPTSAFLAYHQRKRRIAKRRDDKLARKKARQNMGLGSHRARTVYNRRGRRR